MTPDLYVGIIIAVISSSFGAFIVSMAHRKKTAAEAYAAANDGTAVAVETITDVLKELRYERDKLSKDLSNEREQFSTQLQMLSIQLAEERNKFQIQLNSFRTENYELRQTIKMLQVELNIIKKTVGIE